MKIYRLIIVFFVLVALSIVFNQVSDKIPSVELQLRNFQKELIRKIEISHDLIKETKERNEHNLQVLIQEAERNGIIIQVYRHDSLIFWTNNSIAEIPKKCRENKKIKTDKILNTWYTIIYSQGDEENYVSLIPLKSEYLYENKYLYSGFRKDFKFQADADILLIKGNNRTAISDKSGNDIFYLKIKQENTSSLWMNVLSTLSLFGAIILLLFTIYKYIKSLKPGKRQNVIIVGIIISVALIRILQLLFLPVSDRQFLFEPSIYAHTWLIPNMADLVINTLLVLFVSVLLQKLFTVDPELLNKEKVSQDVILTVLNAMYLLLFLYAHYITYSLVQNSIISFKPFESEQISAFTVLAFAIISINFTMTALHCEWLFSIIVGNVNFYRGLLNLFLISIPFALILFIFRYPGDFISFLFILFFYVLFYFLLQMRKKGKPIPFLVTLILAMTFYTVYLLTQQARIKDLMIKKTMVENLANEHDPIAEFLFPDIELKLQNDILLQKQLESERIDLSSLQQYIERNYFSGFWKKYEVWINVCTPFDSVYFELPYLKSHHCYDYYGGIRAREGISLPNTDFYYLNNLNGSISYIGSVSFPLDDEYEEITLYIELDSKLTKEQLGYPDLLIDDKFRPQKYLSSFSSAKYYQNYLVAHSGEYHYSLHPDIFGNQKAYYSIILLDGYEHLIYRTDEDNLIVASTPSIKIFDLMVTFSYFFVFLYAIAFLMSLILKRPLFEVAYQFNFRSKIQFVIVSVLIISLILIGVVTVYYTQSTYQNNQHNLLSEKIQSVYVEIDHKLALAEDLRDGWSDKRYDNLDQLLIKFSDVFYSDINLYDPDGNLIATSRPEVFNLGLKSKKINPVAYHKMRDETRSQYVHKEKIDKLDYLSAYVPFFNTDGKLLAYLNLPYFTKQKEFQEDISRLVVAIVNTYVLLLFLTLIIAIVISNQVTRPLELLQLKFREFDINKKYNTIDYERDDEIGNLVSEYNRMVFELEESVKLLAKSERETAWREMAKQIAHEIKNPLTPMKLSVQQLKRAWNDKKEGYESYLNNVTQTLIEQIDHLSLIASEFSNFAKMPKTKIEEVELIDILNKTVQLFSQSKDYEIRTSFKSEKVKVLADKDQLSRVFINLLKNAIQAIPEDKKGIIEIRQHIKDKKVIIQIKDNGKGIAPEIESKLFVPNFTTKSGGMGLGLAIVKNIIDEIDGTISFKTDKGEGSVFTVTIPTGSKQ